MSPELIEINCYSKYSCNVTHEEGAAAYCFAKKLMKIMYEQMRTSKRFHSFFSPTKSECLNHFLFSDVSKLIVNVKVISQRLSGKAPHIHMR